MKNISALDLLFPNQYRRAILAVLFAREGKWIHLREIARMGQLASIGSAKKELALLHEADLLKMQRYANQTQYCVNQAHPLYADLRSLLQKTLGLVPLLRDALQALSADIEVACLFGSVARGLEHAHSDIDILLIGSVSFAQAHAALYPAQDQMGREINPKVLSRADWEQLKASGNTFALDVLEHEKILLVGQADAL